MPGADTVHAREQRLRQGSRYPHPSQGRAVGHLVSAADAARSSGDPERAIKLLCRAVNHDQRSKEAWRALAEFHSGARRAICLLWAEQADRYQQTDKKGRPRRSLPRSALVALAVAVVAAIGGWAGLEAPYRDEFLPGVSANGVLIGGLTLEHARERVRTVADKRGERVVLLHAAGGEWGIRAHYLLRDTVQADVDAAWEIGHESSALARLRSRWVVFTSQYAPQGGPMIDAAAVTQLVAQLRTQIERPVRDATLSSTERGWWVNPEQTGLALDSATAREVVAGALREHAWAPTTNEPIVVDLPIVVTSPRIAGQNLASLRARLDALRAAPLKVEAAGRSWSVDRSTLVRWTLTPAHGAGRVIESVAPDFAAIGRQIDLWRAEIDRPPRQSRIEWSGDRVRELVQGRPGQALDRAAAIRALAANLQREERSVTLPVRNIAPPPGEAEALGLVAELGRGESWFVTYTSPDRDANVLAGGLDVDGVLLPPGEIFSFTRTVGSITWEKGYRWGDMIESGQLRPSLGGGICQVSTTVFRAALWSGLEIVERHPHAWRLPWYEVEAHPGMDATIAFGGPDLKFRNNTSGHIMLRVITDLEQKRQTVVVYGTPTDRRVVIESRGAGLQFQLQRRVMFGGEVLGEDLFTSAYTQ